MLRNAGDQQNPPQGFFRFFNNKQLVDTESHYAVYPYNTFQCVDISHFISFRISLVITTLCDLDGQPSSQRGFYIHRSLSLLIIKLHWGALHTFDIPDTGLCNTLAVYSTLSLLCIRTLKRSKFYRLSFLELLSPAGKPTHFESLNSDKIRPR